jgi:hypothetical protein
MVVPLCESTPTATEDDVVSAIIGCSQNGLVKTLTGVTKDYYLEPMVRLYWQGTTYGNGDNNLHPLEVTYFPDLPQTTPNVVFADQVVEINLTTQPGYNEAATSVLLSAQAGLGIQAWTNDLHPQTWHLVIIVSGRERIRITGGQGSGYNTDVAQFVIPMPTDPTRLRIEVQRQVANYGNTVAEGAYATVYLEGFLFS